MLDGAESVFESEMEIAFDGVRSELAYSTTVLLDHMVAQARVTPQLCSSAHTHAGAQCV